MIIREVRTKHEELSKLIEVNREALKETDSKAERGHGSVEGHVWQGAGSDG